LASSSELKLKGYDAVTIEIADTITAIASDWNQHSGADSYTGADYLQLLERSGPIGYKYYYVLVRKRGIVQALLYCQHKTINLREDYRFHTHSDRFIDKLGVSITKFLFSFVKHEMLICGNVLLTGEYGIRIESGLQGEINKLVPAVLEEVRSFVKEKTGKRIKSTLLKDFYLEGPFKSQVYKADNYTNFSVQPDMVLNVDKAWDSYQDYLSAVKSKYRVKFKKVKKKGKDLEFRVLSTEEAQQYNSEMYAMYKDTADRASYSMFVLQEPYFAELKETMGPKMILTGVFLENKMVAFFTYVKNKNLGDAHFLGYNVQLNTKYQIYFNILLQLIETAIDEGADYLNLSRTALEIKSSVGAVPYDMEVHLQYHNSFINRFARSILSKFVPETEWQQRMPFK